jgi:hypothetical protein
MGVGKFIKLGLIGACTGVCIMYAPAGIVYTAITTSPKWVPAAYAVYKVYMYFP